MAMQTWSEQVARKIGGIYGLERFSDVLDVGGGTGALLAGVLSAHPAEEHHPRLER